MKCISDLTKHSSFVKGLAIWEEEKIIATASDKIISLWDMNSL